MADRGDSVRSERVYTAVHMIGIRELRADLAAHVRRAAGGETTVISIGGSPAAALDSPGDER